MKDAQVKEICGVTEHEKVLGILCIGEPDIEFERSVVREQVKVHWIE